MDIFTGAIKVLEGVYALAEIAPSKDFTDCQQYPALAQMFTESFLAESEDCLQGFQACCHLPKNALIKYHHVVGQCDLFCKGQSSLSTQPSGRMSLLHGDIA